MKVILFVLGLGIGLMHYAYYRGVELIFAIKAAEIAVLTARGKAEVEHKTDQLAALIVEQCVANRGGECIVMLRE